jgi:hypothetical protein
LFLSDAATGDYRPIDRAVYARIVEGAISLASARKAARFAR